MNQTRAKRISKKRVKNFDSEKRLRDVAKFRKDFIDGMNGLGYTQDNPFTKFSL